MQERGEGFRAHLRLPRRDPALRQCRVGATVDFPESADSQAPSPREDDLSQGILDAINLESYRNEAREVMHIRLEDADAEVAPVPTGEGAHLIQPEMDALSSILANFNDMFGNIDWNDADNVWRQISEIPAMVAKDEKYQNAMKNSDEQNARLESERALQDVIISIMADNMELFKQFQDNPSFKRALSDLVFHKTYHREGEKYAAPAEKNPAAHEFLEEEMHLVADRKRTYSDENE